MSRFETSPSNDSVTSTQVPTALLSCQSCRRRKVRCHKQLPSCSLCVKISRTCTYPSGPLKPGPKLGSSQRSLKRPRCSKGEGGHQLTGDHDSRDVQQGNATEPRRNSSLDEGLLPGTFTQRQPQSGPQNDRLEETTPADSTNHNNQQSPGSTDSSTTSLNLPALSSLIQPSHEVCSSGRSTFCQA